MLVSIRYSDTSRWSRFSRAFLRFFGQGRQFPSVADPQSSFQAIFEMIGVGVVQFNLDGRLIKCNRAFCELVGYTLEEVLRVPAGGLTHPDDLKKDHEERSRLLCGEAPSYTREKRYVRKDGSIVWVMVSVSLIRRSSGRPKFYVGVIQDITSRRTAEQARSESRARLRVALEAGRMGTWERELATGRDVWSEQQELLFGLRPGSFDQRHETFVQMVHPEDRAGMEAALQHAIEHREPYRSEFRVVFPDGAVRWMSGRGDVIWSAQGRPTHVVGVTLDITDRKRAEQERAELLVREQRARADAEAANRRKDQFLAVLSHELRTPLTPVLGRVALMHRDSALTPELRSGLDMIRRNVELEARLIDDLLDMTRLIRGSLRLNRELIDAHQKLRNALEIYQGEISLRRLEVALDLSAEHYRVLGDASRVQQIFWNLISNAVKYTPVGGRITIRSYNREHAQADTPDGSLLVVEVADTGIGIEPEMMQRLFDPFEQGEQTLARRYGGLGLGLSISRSLARMHGGDLKARSEGKNGGSTFTVEFPTAPADLLAARAAPSPRRELRILLVEDNEDTLRVMARLLRLSGYQVKTASGMRPALDLAVREEFDLLISDIGLPDGTGWELMRELRVRRPVKGIALSGFSMDEDVQKSRNVGFLEHLCKPINPQELEDAIQRAAT